MTDRPSKIQDLKFIARKSIQNQQIHFDNAVKCCTPNFTDKCRNFLLPPGPGETWEKQRIAKQRLRSQIS